MALGEPIAIVTNDTFKKQNQGTKQGQLKGCYEYVQELQLNIRGWLHYVLRITSLHSQTSGQKLFLGRAWSVDNINSNRKIHRHQEMPNINIIHRTKSIHMYGSYSPSLVEPLPVSSRPHVTSSKVSRDCLSSLMVAGTSII